VPADLNAWLYQMERNLAWAANVTGDAATSQRFNQEAAQRREAMMALLWDDSCGEGQGGGAWGSGTGWGREHSRGIAPL
jgi:alpha,alpha-trehalase